MQRMTQVAIAIAFLSLALPAAAKKPIVYPANGQSAAQQNKDDGECYVWAKQQTGVDPANPPKAAAPAKKETTASGTTPGAGARGAVKGAVIGSAVGGDAGKGAAVGAVAARSRSRRENEAAAQQQQQASAKQSQQAMDTYYRAYGACMSGRGYTLN